MSRIHTRTRAGLAVLAVTGTLAAAGPIAADARSAAPAGGCRVVRLAEPAWGYDGSVMDIEVVDGVTTYYGSTHDRDKNGVEHQRALVWRGLDSRPVRVGPPGYDEDIAYELTASGLINGESTEFATGRSVHWVQDLDTMAITVFDTDSGPRGADHGTARIRRINDRGEAAGLVVRDDSEPWTDAVAFDSPDSPMELLPGSGAAADAIAMGINDHGQRVGYLSTRPIPEDPAWYWLDPVIWEPDGSVTPMAVAGLDAVPRAIKNDGSASGSGLYGADLATAHVEPVYWPDPSTAVGLGVLPGGGWGDVFGMDEGGWLVGAMDRGTKRRDRLARDRSGVMTHAFLRTPETTEGTVRILPSLYALAKGEDDWRRWAGTAVHAVNRDVRQAASGSHVEFRYGRPVGAPTVWLEADRCGEEVATTHHPFDVAGSSTSARATARTTTRRALHDAQRRSDRVVRAWRRSIHR